MLPFRHLLRARYLECDAQGIVFNARYGDWTDLATTELLRAIDPRHLEPGGIDYRLRKQTTEWLAPARFDDVVEAVPVVTAVGTTSFTVETTFSLAATGARLARVETTYVLVDAAAGAKRPVPEAVRAALLAGAPGRVADHAGVGGGRVLRIVRAADRVTMPWKNGGGITHELWREAGGPTSAPGSRGRIPGNGESAVRHEPPTRRLPGSGEGLPAAEWGGQGAPGFGVRLSIAEVAADGPFSRFPGVDRVLTVLDGPGFRLTRADGLEIRLDRPHAPFAFLGEDAWECTLVGQGPVHDFNVMVDRSAWTAAVSHVGPGIVDARWVLALGPGRVGGVPIGRWELAELDGAVLLEGEGLAVRVRRLLDQSQVARG